MGKTLDTGRVNHTDDVLSIGEEGSQRFPIDIGCLHTGMHVLNVLGAKSLLELLKTSGGVRKLLVATVATLTQQGDIEGEFGEVNAENADDSSPKDKKRSLFRTSLEATCSWGWDLTRSCETSDTMHRKPFSVTASSASVFCGLEMHQSIG